MNYGLSDQELSFLEQLVLIPLKNSGARVFLFGSRARGTHHKYSDLDILVASEIDLSRLVNDILERLEQSNFPYKVDIVEDRLLSSNYRPGVERDLIQL